LRLYLACQRGFCVPCTVAGQPWGIRGAGLLPLKEPGTSSQLPIVGYPSKLFGRLPVPRLAVLDIPGVFGGNIEPVGGGLAIRARFFSDPSFPLLSGVSQGIGIGPSAGVIAFRARLFDAKTRGQKCLPTVET